MRRITRIKLILFKTSRLLPFIIGAATGIVYSVLKGSGLNWLYFSAIGAAASLGFFISGKSHYRNRDKGRLLCLSLIGPIVLIFINIIDKVNYQLSEVAFSLDYLFLTGRITEALAFFLAMRIFLSIMIGRSRCGWACRTAFLFEWLPIKQNSHIPEKWTRIRFIILFITLCLPVFFILFNFDNGRLHYEESNTNHNLLLWIIIANVIYYITGVILAFLFKKQRAFCKIICPEGLLMSLPSKFSIAKKGPAGPRCIECGKCNDECPMDIFPMQYISKGKKINSSECLHCLKCLQICPVGAIK